MDRLLKTLIRQYCFVAELGIEQNTFNVIYSEFSQYESFTRLTGFLAWARSKIYLEDRDGFTDFIDLTKERPDVEHFEFRFVNAKKEIKWYLLTLCRDCGSNFVLSVMDITEKKHRDAQEFEDCIGHLTLEAITDEQTGFLNRKGLNKFKNQILQEVSESENLRLLISVFDLNGLKHINDTFGHAAGDLAIKLGCEVIKGLMPEDAVLVRTGGDEFLSLAKVAKGDSWFVHLDDKVENSCKDLESKYSLNFEFGISVGSIETSCKSSSIDLDRYVREADALMYHMKLKEDKYIRN